MRKPDKNCFNKVLEDHNLKAQETLFIDDNLRNIKGAKKLGINTIHYSSPKKLKADLIKYL